MNAAVPDRGTLPDGDRSLAPDRPPPGDGTSHAQDWHEFQLETALLREASGRDDGTPFATPGFLQRPRRWLPSPKQPHGTGGETAKPETGG